MAAFAGIVRFDGAPFDRRIEEQLRRSVTATQAGLVTFAHGDAALFALRTPRDGGTRHEVPLATGRATPPASVFAVVARLDNREELGERLGLSLAELARTPDASLLQHMFERWGADGLARCLGAFAFAAWDSGARRLTLGRDYLGQCPLFFHRGRHHVAFATSIRSLLALPDVPRELDEMVLARFLAVNLHDTAQTFYRGVERVLSRAIVVFEAERVERRYYWSPTVDAPPPYRHAEDYVERARELLDQAVTAAFRETPHIAVSASGGLDSSAFVSTAARLGFVHRMTCYTLVPPADLAIRIAPGKYLDERDKMQALARMYPGLDVRLIAPEDSHAYEEDDRQYFARTALPALNPLNLGWFCHLYDAAARDGHRVLATGMHGNFGLSWTGKLSLGYLLRHRRWAEFWRETRAVARESGRSVPHTLAAETLVQSGPRWLLRLLYRLAIGDPDSLAFYSALAPTFIKDHDLMRKWRSDGASQRRWRRHFRQAPQWRAEWLFDRNLTGRDGALTEEYGFEPRWPLGDRRLLEFLLAVPEPMFRRDGVPRSFARAVLADRLPREIVEERRSGIQAGAWFRRLDRRRTDIAADVERLESSPLARRLLDLQRLRTLVDQWPADEHAAELRRMEFQRLLGRGLHVGSFIRWVEGGNR